MSQPPVTGTSVTLVVAWVGAMEAAEMFTIVPNCWGLG